MTRKGGAKRPNWKAIRKDYEAGDLTIEQVAQKHGVTHAAIQKRVTREGWRRRKQPESAQFQRKTPIMGELIVIPPEETGNAGPQLGADTDNDLAGPQTPLEVILTHRRAIARARALSGKLVAELEQQTMGEGVLHALIDEHLAGGGVNGAMVRQMLRSFLETGHRAKVLLNLSKALGELVNLERQAFGMDGPKAIDDPVARFNLEAARADGSKRSPEEIARAILDTIERASREKQGRTMQ